MIRAHQAMQPNGARRRHWRRVLPSTAALLVLAVSLSACALGSSDDEPGASAGQGSSYPNLARVPDEAPRPTPEELRESLLRGLIADRANARYTDEVLTNESTAVPPAPPPPKGRPRVEIAWDTPRKLTEEQVADEPAPPVEITWETDRVEPKPEPEPESAAAPAAAPLEPVEIVWDETPVAPAPAAAAEAVEAAAPEPVEIAWNETPVAPAPAAAEAVEAAVPEPVEIVWDETPVAPAPAAAAEAAEAAAPEPVEIAWNEAPAELEPETAPAEVTTAAGPGSNELVAILQFAEASWALNEQDREVLGAVLALQQARGGRLHLVGYSDSPVKADDPMEQRTASLRLSLERASAVASTLVGLGADRDSLLVEANAVAQPGSGGPAPAAPANARADRRIVEIFLEY